MGTTMSALANAISSMLMKMLSKSGTLIMQQILTLVRSIA
jgi:hypothetical protein